MANAVQQAERQLPSQTATTYHEVHCVFHFPISHRDFWMLGITEQ
jgi:hypothetical protein